MDRKIIQVAHELIKNGYSFHDGDKLRDLGYTNTELITAMEDIFSNVIFIRMYNLSNATVKYYSKAKNPPMTLTEIRSYMYQTSLLMLCDGNGLNESIGNDELDYAVSYLIYEVENNE